MSRIDLTVPIPMNIPQAKFTSYFDFNLQSLWEIESNVQQSKIYSVSVIRSYNRQFFTSQITYPFGNHHLSFIKFQRHLLQSILDYTAL